MALSSEVLPCVTHWCNLEKAGIAAGMGEDPISNNRSTKVLKENTVKCAQLDRKPSLKAGWISAAMLL